jgi:20S proteasome alpha/beta subunit
VTITVCLHVPEGIVLASESRQVYPNEKGNFRVASDNAQKVFDLSEKIGGVTFGQASLSRKSILSLVEQYKATSETFEGKSVRDVTEGLGGFVDEKWQLEAKANPENKPENVGFIIAGYDKEGKRSIFECSIPGPSVVEIASSDTSGLVWRGQTDVVTRLVKGFDPRIEKLSWFKPEFVSELDQLNYVVRFDALTLQDAIDLAVFLIRTTIDMQRFSDGISLSPGDVPGTGGPIDICVIRPNEGLNWVQRKELKGEYP